MRCVPKPEALELLQAYKRALPQNDCVLCALASGEAAAHDAIAHSEHGLVLLNRFGQRRGHLMVLPRRHVEHVHELEWPAYAGLQRLAYDAGFALQRVLQPLRIFNAVLGSGAAIATSYAHLHIHVVPLHESGDRARPARVFSWSEGVVVYEEEEAVALAAELRAAWPAR
jgi:diadenosine tetraphosphate (Ap4A) HIT family hydrolase